MAIATGPFTAVYSFTGVLAISTVATFVYFASLIIYRIFFHPLSRFPGPLVNKFCPVPPIFSLLRGRWAMDTKTLHDIYGPVVRVSPSELAFNSAQAWEDIYAIRHGRPNMAKDPLHAGPVHAVKGVISMQYEPDEAQHSRQKRALAYSFSTKALKEQEPIIASHTHKLMEKIRSFSKQGQTFNISDWFNFLTFDTIGDLAFKEHYGCLDEVFAAVKAGALVQATRRFATAGTPLQTLLLRLFGDITSPNRTHIRLTREQVKKRLESSNDDHRDFIWYILQQQDKYDLREDEIIANSALFILAGSETTANALSGLTARLLRDTRTYEKLVTKIRGEFQGEQDITHERISKLPYVNACINEGLRVHPPITPGLLRTVPDGGDEIAGHRIPAGTTVSVSAWAAAYNPVNFHNPDEYLPERWFDDKYSSDIKKATQPFSLGPRACLGKNLAWMEMRLALVQLLWHFDLMSPDNASLWDPEGQMKHMKAWMVWQTPELNVKATAVQR